MCEAAVFFLAWIGAAIHAGIRTVADPPWRGHCLAAAGLGGACVLLNWVTTGDHPFRTLARGDLAVLGVDAVLALTAAAALGVAVRLGRAQRDQALSEASEHA